MGRLTVKYEARSPRSIAVNEIEVGEVFCGKVFEDQICSLPFLRIYKGLVNLECPSEIWTDDPTFMIYEYDPVSAEIVVKSKGRG